VEEDEGVESNLWVVLDEPETTGGGGAAVEQGAAAVAHVGEDAPAALGIGLQAPEQ